MGSFSQAMYYCINICQRCSAAWNDKTIVRSTESVLLLYVRFNFSGVGKFVLTLTKICIFDCSQKKYNRFSVMG